MSKTSRTINNIKEMLDNVSGLYLDNDIEKLEKYVRAFCNKAEEENNFLQVFDREDAPKEDKKIEKLNCKYTSDVSKLKVANKVDEIIELLNNSVLLSEKEVSKFLDKVNGE